MNVAKRPSKPKVAKHNKHKRRPAKPPSKPKRPPFRGAGAGATTGLEVRNRADEDEEERRPLTEQDIVDQVEQCIDSRNVGRVLEQLA